MSMSVVDQKDLVVAKNLLENPGLAAKITGLLGTPIEKGLELLPSGVEGKIGDITRIALEKSADAALFTMSDGAGEDSSNWWHKLAAGAAGAGGGFFGLAGLAVELPISTTIMLRSIADIARSQGEVLSSPETKIQCICVLGLGGRSKQDDATDSGYILMRTALARAVSEAAEHYAGKAVASKGVPAIVRLISVVASRFSIQVTEKAAAQAVPVIGAVSGAVINTLFMDHFQDMAKGHFTYLRLERKYGKDVVESAYQKLPKLSK